MNQQPPAQQPEVGGTWVRLHLVPQTESSEMPLYFDGYLTQETPGSYVLTKTIVVEEDEDFDVTTKVVEELNFVNRTYVWRCQVLGSAPLDITMPTLFGGGMG